MQYKALATVLFAAAAVAAPADFDLSDLKSYQEVASQVESAVPTEWAKNVATDPKFAQSVWKDLEAGTYPPWYSSLPADIKSSAPKPSEIAQGISKYGDAYSKYDDYMTAFLGTATATITGSGSGTASRSVATATGPSATSGSSSGTVTPSPSSSGSASSSASGSASGSASPSGSDAASSSADATATSTGGAPAATGPVAMGLAGAAGVLGLALAL
ncbi:hypothetical protein N7492_000698 [Penicillium capsulatum]|uniref:Uncharacterized protein n=1 Tax=Penicillium capsulatum TaxID=69766 RepID=A0A9W9M0C7_9EURO|nr:hypothetical protein N7492_000698 [Penicillium capsulatum]KAJ6130244.1 hypothetical protein N7512_003024 [Penicillium capsulatum]